jgi:hypothetical protein
MVRNYQPQSSTRRKGSPQTGKAGSVGDRWDKEAELWMVLPAPKGLVQVTFWSTQQQQQQQQQ